MNALIGWLDNRTGYKAVLHEALYERIPGGARWRYVWGSTLVYTFVLQMITGFFLWTAYSPSAQTAWESVFHIQYDMQGGWLVRGLHHYAAQAMVVLLALHLFQVVWDGAYRAPREVNFWLGLILMQIVLGLSLTGYLLPWDQKGYWATQVATNIMGITPGVGPEVQKLASGGSNYGHHTLTRFFALHAGLLPALLIAFLALHIWVFRKHGITVPNPDRRAHTTFWPEQVLKDALACLGVFLVVIGLAWWRGAELGAPADPADQYSAARPEWYFLFLFQLLKYFPGDKEIVGTLVIPGAIMLMLFLMPFIGRNRAGHWFNVGFIVLLLGAVVGLTVVAIQEDRSDAGYQFAVREAEENAERVRELAHGPQGIGIAGAGALLRIDAKTQGPRLFAKNCASCHRWDGKDGRGRDVTEMKDEKEVAAKPTATDLAKFGSREWVQGVLKDYKHTFEHAHFPDGEPFESGSMGEWTSENVPKMSAVEIDSVVEFIYAQSGAKDIDAKKVEAGKEFFEIGNDNVAESCSSCHAMKPVGADAPLEGGGNGPDLTGYGSEAWLKSFIADPGTKQHYGKKNAMPGFSKRLSPEQMQMLVDWMQHRWYEPPHAAASPESK